MKITLNWLKEKGACKKGFAWFKAQKETDIIKVLKKLGKQKHYQWANWLIVQVMTRPQYLSYAIFSAEQVIENYEKEYPDDKRPRNAVEAARKVLTGDTEENRSAACGAAESAACGAAYSAACGAAREAMQQKILDYGIKLLSGQAGVRSSKKD